MTPEQISELKSVANASIRSEQVSKSWSEGASIDKYFHNLATPEAVLYLIAQVEALSIPGKLIRNAQSDAVLGFAQAMVEVGVAGPILMTMAKGCADKIRVMPAAPQPKEQS